MIAWHNEISANAAIDLAAKSYELLFKRTAHDANALNSMNEIPTNEIDEKGLSAGLANLSFCSTSIRSIDDMSRWLFAKTLNLTIWRQICSSIVLWVLTNSQYSIYSVDNWLQRRWEKTKSNRWHVHVL